MSEFVHTPAHGYQIYRGIGTIPIASRPLTQGGMGGMEIVLKHLETAVGMNSCKRGTVFHSVDVDSECQRVLVEHNPVHVFKDILSFLQLPVRLAVQRIMHESGSEVQSLIQTSQEAQTNKEKQQAKDALKRVGESLLRSLMNCMDSFDDGDFFVEKTACAKHPGDPTKPCFVFTPSDQPGEQPEPDPKEYFMAGTSCTDWSSMGSGNSLAGHTVLPFAVELQIIKRRKPRVFFHECTRNFRPQILGEYLEGTLAGFNLFFWVSSVSLNG